MVTSQGSGFQGKNTGQMLQFDPCPWDLVVIVSILIYTWIAYSGMIPTSVDGVNICSDLACYAQHLAGISHRAPFAQDPILAVPTPSNTLPTIETFLARLLQPDDNYVLGLFRAAAIAVAGNYIAYYIVGRLFFKSIILSVLLSVLMTTTVWVGFGTFWGLATGDVTPRVFFSAYFALLFVGAVLTIDRPLLRPIIMFAAGAGIYIHGISSLNASCMFFVVFAFSKPDSSSTSNHIKNLIVCVLAWAVPTFLFFHGVLTQSGSFTSEKLEILQQTFDKRFAKDYGKLFHGDEIPLLPLAIIGYIVIMYIGTTQMKKLVKICILMFFGICVALILSFVESSLSVYIDRMPMGREIPRGARFLVPIIWLMVVGAGTCLMQKFPHTIFIMATISIVCIVTFDEGRWMRAFSYEVRDVLGLQQSQKTVQEMEEARKYLEALKALDRLAPPGEPVLGIPDAMAVRYLLHRPLVHSFKDGSFYLYNRDFEGAKKWLHLAKLLGDEGGVKFWLASGARWLLCDDPEVRECLVQEGAGTIVWSNETWFIARRNDNAPEDTAATAR
jgi:hypothetical protein